MADSKYRVNSIKWPGLSKLLEEMNELGVELGKLIENDGRDVYQWDGSDLRKKIREELSDVMATAQFFYNLNFTSEEQVEIDNRKKAKLQKYYDWRDSDA